MRWPTCRWPGERALASRCCRCAPTASLTYPRSRQPCSGRRRVSEPRGRGGRWWRSRTFRRASRSSSRQRLSGRCARGTAPCSCSTHASRSASCRSTCARSAVTLRAGPVASGSVRRAAPASCTCGVGRSTRRRDPARRVCLASRRSSTTRAPSGPRRTATRCCPMPNVSRCGRRTRPLATGSKQQPSCAAPPAQRATSPTRRGWRRG
mmetsp:Transcript_45285/g.147140  ORF Transcript_45285/g.147140 Transcript_45285/m.147140 type:complete len:208 (-) Transcript_45285:418-1041(-)